MGRRLGRRLGSEKNEQGSHLSVSRRRHVFQARVGGSSEEQDGTKRHFCLSVHLSRPKASTPANGQGDRIRQQTLQEIFTRERCRPDRKSQRSQSRFRRILHRQVQERDVSLHGIQRHRQVPGRLARPSEKLQRHPTRCTARFGSVSNRRRHPVHLDGQTERWRRCQEKENSVSIQSRGQSSHHPQGQNVPQRISSKMDLRSVRSESSVQKGKLGGVQTERLKRRRDPRQFLGGRTAKGGQDGAVHQSRKDRQEEKDQKREERSTGTLSGMALQV